MKTPLLPPVSAADESLALPAVPGSLAATCREGTTLAYRVEPAGREIDLLVSMTSRDRCRFKLGGKLSTSKCRLLFIKKTTNKC